MELNLNQCIKDLAGIEIKNTNMGKMVANVLISGNDNNNPIKKYDMAMKLFNDGKINVDDSDYSLIEVEITNTKLLNVLAKAQILKLLKEQKNG